MAHVDDDLEQLRARVAALETELERSRAREAAASADARYWRRILETLPEFVSIFDERGLFLYLNRIDPQYEGQKYIGRPLAEVISPESLEHAQQAIRDAIHSGKTSQYESYDPHRDHWYNCSVGPVSLEDGSSYAVIVSHTIDRQKKAERELRDARDLWDSLVSNSPDVILLMDADSKILFISKTVTGYTREEAVGGLGTDFVQPQHRQMLLSAIRAASETRQPQICEAQDVRASLWWRITLVPVRDSQRGDLVLSIGHDVTESRRTELALRESEARLRMLLSQVPAIVWTVDRDMRILSADGAGLAMLELSPSEWQDKTLMEFYGTSDPEFPPLAAHRLALTGKSETYEQTINDRDFHKRVEPLRNAAGEVMGVVGVGIDVSDRKASEEQIRRARDELERRVIERTAELDAVNQHLREDIAQRELVEQQLRESEERFRAIADTVPVAIVITRLSDGLVVYVNRRLCELFAAEPSDLLDRKAPEFYVEPSERVDLMNRLRETSSVLDLELWLQSPTGKRMLVSGSYQPITFDGVACVLAGFIDLTKRMETEQALLAERRLLKRLLELHERDRQLISYEIHDGIVQDMTASLMFLESSRPAEITEEHPSHESYASGLRLLRGSIDEARRLINGLRPPVLEDEGVVAAVVALVSELERDSGIEIELVTDVKFQRLAPALEMAIYRIVQEGLNNVWHHSRSSHARVELVQRDDTIEIRVQDWGIGFDPTKVSKRRYGLMGMRERARLLNGRAIVRSAPGEGTTLHIELPLIDALMPTVE